MTPAEIAGLAERCECEPASYALECAIEEAFDLGRVPPPPYGNSLDAAVAFVERVLPGSSWCLTKDREADVEWGVRREERWFHSPNAVEDGLRVYAATPALALVAAALRALAAQDGGGA